MFSNTKPGGKPPDPPAMLLDLMSCWAKKWEVDDIKAVDELVQLTIWSVDWLTVDDLTVDELTLDELSWYLSKENKPTYSDEDYLNRERKTQKK